MAKPTNLSTGNCESKSSTCVQWDGPDFECGDMKFCTGDSMTVAMKALATELCSLRETISTTLEISTYNTTCLTGSGDVLPITSFRDIIQTLIIRVCANTAAIASGSGSQGSSSNDNG